ECIARPLSACARSRNGSPTTAVIPAISCAKLRARMTRRIMIPMIPLVIIQTRETSMPLIRLVLHTPSKAGNAMNDSDKDCEHWSQVANEWIKWALTPDHDAFWAYRDALITFIGGSDGKALDVGCGEGRSSRALMSCGYRVTAV